MLDLGSRYIECVLCHGALPPYCDEVFYKHMNDQHRIFFNIKLVFTLSSLDKIKLSAVEKLVEIEKESNKESIIRHDEKDSNNDREEGNVVEMTIDKTENNDSFKNNELFDVKAVKDEKLTLPKLFGKQETKCTCGCDKLFESKSAMLSHIRVELRGHKQCEYCAKSFKKEKFYQKHLLKSHPNNRYGKQSHGSNICEECGTSYKSKHYAREHFKLSHNKDNFVCDICCEQIQGYGRFKRHQKRAHREAQVCKECNKSFKNVYQHMKVSHTEDKDKKYQCNTCGKGFVDKTRLKEHVVIHDTARPFPCKYCQFSSKTKHNRDLHENQVHSSKIK